MISPENFNYLLLVWIGLGLILLPLLLNVTVPYGRHRSSKWGPMVNNKMGWIVMEIPVVLVFSWFFWSGDAPKSAPVYLMYALFMLHYFNRIFIFPLQLKGRKKQMPLIIMLFAIFFNLTNGFFNGYWFGSLSPSYDLNWFLDWRFILGIILFFTGMYINIRSDQQLIGLRTSVKRDYYIPRGWLFNYISSPNLFGEIIEWIGWALLCWCLPAMGFAFWTMVNLIPRALDHHKWYKTNFKEYPTDRKAIFPGIL